MRVHGGKSRIFGWYQPTVIELHNTVRQIKISVVVADDHNGLASILQFWQELRVKERLELRILVRGPFIEHVNRTILQVSRQQRQTLALPLRQGGRREYPILNPDLVIELLLDQVLMGLAVQVR